MMDLEKIKAGLTGCGSHSCFIKPPVSVGTNGQCTCLDDKTKMQRYIFITNNEITSLREQLEIAKNDGWISVKDRLPNDDCRVVAATWTTLTGKQHIDIASYRAGGKYFDVVVTHWQPLPEPPKE